MDSTLATLTALLLDPFLTCGEAEREAVAFNFAQPTPSRPASTYRSGRTGRTRLTSTDDQEPEATSFVSC